MDLPVLNCTKLAPQRVLSELFLQRRRLETGEGDGLNEDDVRIYAENTLQRELDAARRVPARLRGLARPRVVGHLSQKTTGQRVLGVDAKIDVRTIHHQSRTVLGRASLVVFQLAEEALRRLLSFRRASHRRPDVFQVADGVLIGNGVHDVQRRDGAQRVPQAVMHAPQPEHDVRLSGGDVLQARLEERTADHLERFSPAAEEPRVGGERVIDRHGLQSQLGHDVGADLRETRRAGRLRRKGQDLPRAVRQRNGGGRLRGWRRRRGGGGLGGLRLRCRGWRLRGGRRRGGGRLCGFRLRCRGWRLRGTPHRQQQQNQDYDCISHHNFSPKRLLVRSAAGPPSSYSGLAAWSQFGHRWS